MSARAKNKLGSVAVAAVLALFVTGAASPRTADGHAERWDNRRRITITLDPTLDAISGDAKSAVEKGVAAWLGSGAALPEVAFEVASQPGPAAADGKNRVLLGPIAVPGHEHDVALTISQVDDATGEILDADIVLNQGYSFAVLDRPSADDGDVKDARCDRQAYDVQNVATHELGHVFGLGEDMSDETSTMYIVSSPCQTHKRDLTSSDANAMASLYQTPLAVELPGGGVVEPVTQESSGCR
jgi:hypothetical protein